jgi:hypothetical protein
MNFLACASGWCGWAREAMLMLPPLPRQFSAEIVRSDEGGRLRLFVDGPFQRSEDYTQSGQKCVAISRPNELGGVIYTLDNQRMTYEQVQYSKADFAAEANTDALCDWKVDGTERIDGRECLRFIGHYRWHSAQGYQVCYVDTQTQMRRRMVTFDEAGEKCLTVDYLDAVVGPPDPNLFELPKGYKKVKRWWQWFA